MAYDIHLADRIREYLVRFPGLKIDEKEMFSGIVFMVNDKMCINVSGENLMCRFDPHLQEVIAEKNGFQPMVMKGKELKGTVLISKKNLNFITDEGELQSIDSTEVHLVQAGLLVCLLPFYDQRLRS